MIHFSFVLMSRSRPELFASLCESIQKSMSLNYEIIVGLDKDDPDLDRYIQINKTINHCVLDIRDREDNLHNRINSFLDRINGKYIFVLNDDCKFISGQWDTQAYNLLENFGHIVYGRTRDNSIDRVTDTYAAFPIVSTAAAKKLGFIMDNTYGNHGSDVVTYRIYEAARKVIDLDFIKIDHLLHNSVEALNKRQNDKTALDMINRTMSNGFNVNNLFAMSVQEKADKLK